MAFEKIVIATKQTTLEGLLARFNTREQARFYVEHMGESFDEYENEHEVYHRSLSLLLSRVPSSIRSHVIDRSFVPNYTFGAGDLVVTLGPDGLVVNVAKYLTNQPLLAFNPDRQRIDGILTLFSVADTADALGSALNWRLPRRSIAMARVLLNDGQELHALNDFFVGRQTHVSARYTLSVGSRSEMQSSSGIIVSTGAGSTGWLRSIVTGANRVSAALRKEKQSDPPQDRYALDWEDRELVYSVREPFISKTSGASLVFGRIQAEQELKIVSHMPAGGVIFSDGVEEDFVEFNSGAVAHVGIADKCLSLLVPA